MSADSNANRRGLPWFRAYAEMVDDPKLRLLAFEDRWHFVAILALKCSGVLDGTTDLSLLHRMVAVKLGVQVRELESIAKRLAEVSLVDADSLQPIAWDRRQAPSDSSRDRTKAWRDRHQATSYRHGDAEVTAQKESKKEIKNKKDQPQEQERSRGSRLPKDWVLPDDWREWAVAQRPGIDVDLEAAKFADFWHAKAGKDATKLNWEATWRNWTRNASTSRGGFTQVPPRTSVVDRVAANIRAGQAERDSQLFLEGEHVRIPR